MDAKQENQVNNMIAPNAEEEKWWEDVQTFDFGVNLDCDDEAANAGPKRFAQVSDEVVNNMAKKKNAKRTDESTKSAVKILQDYCHEAGIYFPDNTATAVDLDFILSKFHIGARTRKGEMYKINSMKSIRFALQQFFLQSNLVDIINDPGLNDSNKVFQNVLKDVKTAGKGDTDHYLNGMLPLKRGKIECRTKLTSVGKQKHCFQCCQSVISQSEERSVRIRK